MLAVHGDWVKKETLAVSLGVSAPAAGQRTYREELKVNGLPVTVEVSKA